jgi:hypothetical protein
MERVERTSVLAVVAASLSLVAGAGALVACADTYCQSGPRYGTTCYSGATVQGGPHDPNTPVAPLPPPGHTGLAGFGASPQKAVGPPPEMFGHVKRAPSDAGADGASDAGTD